MRTAEFIWRGPELKELAQEYGQRGLMKAGEVLLSEAKEEVPVDEGTLRASGMVRKASASRVEVSFNTAYAARQHEELSYRHPKGGKAKYLEDPLRQKEEVLQEIIRFELLKGVIRASKG